VIYLCGESKRKKKQGLFCLIFVCFGEDGVLFFCLFVDDDVKGKSFVEKFVCVFGELFLDSFFVCQLPPCYVLVFIEALIFKLQRQRQLSLPFMKHLMCVCFHCKDAKNETFVSCRTILRTFSELHLLGFDLQASKTKASCLLLS